MELGLIMLSIEKRKMKFTFKYKDCDIEVSNIIIPDYKRIETSINLTGTFNGFNCQIKHKRLY